MAYAIVQEESAITLSGSTTTVDVAMPGNVTAGNRLIAIVVHETAAVTVTISDTVGSNDTWSQIGSKRTGDAYDMWVYELASASAGAATIRATFSGNVAFPRMWVVEASGTSGFDKEASQIDVGAGADAVTSGNTAALTSAPALVLGCAYSTDATVAPAAGTGFTDLGVFASGAGDLGRGEHKRVTDTSAVAATFTAGGGDTANNFFCIALVFTETVEVPGPALWQHTHSGIRFR